MSSRVFRLAILFGAFAAAPSWAAITCSATVTDIAAIYDPTVGTPTTVTGSYTVSCNRITGDPNTFAWQLGVNDGANNVSGSTNNVKYTAGTQLYSYETYRSSTHTGGNRWGDTAATRFSGTLNFGGSLTASTTGSFDVELPAKQTVQPAGTYLDTVTANLRNSANTIIQSSTFSVNVLTPASCQFFVPPGNIILNYTAMQNVSANASTTYKVRCTTGVFYNMAFDASPGPLLGLTYSLSLAPSSSGTGNGTPQTYTINGTIAANQAGTCATGVCSGTHTRTITLSW